MKSIFISYRQNDSAIFTGRLFDRLTDYYGADAVFVDIHSITGAVDFRDVIKSRIEGCGVFLAVIGRQWVGSPDRPRRIDDPADPVRIEIEQAIVCNKPIIPVYCDDLDELKLADVPFSLERLVYANAHRIDSGLDFHQHVKRLRQKINDTLFPSPYALTGHLLRRFVWHNKEWLATWAVALFLVFLSRDMISQMLLTKSGLQGAVERADQVAFSQGKGGAYQIARVLPNRKALVDETDIVDTISKTKQTFDVVAVSGSVFYNNLEALRDGLRRGVKFRFLLLDHSNANRENIESYYQHSSIEGNGLEWGTVNSKQAQAVLRQLSEEAKLSQNGSIEVRWLQGPFLNSFWVRDGMGANALGHVELTYHGDATLNPSLRFGRLSPQMTLSLQKQFDYLWGSELAKSEK